MNSGKGFMSTVNVQARSDGFTLVEAVVALALLSLLMTTVLAALRAFGNTQESLEIVAGRTDEVRAVSNFLRESLEATVAGSDGGGALSFGGGAEDGARELSYFVGAETGFEWKARMVFGETYGGTFLVRVAREEDRLVLLWQRPPKSELLPNWEEAMSRLLVDDLQEFEVAYRGSLASDWQGQWLEEESPELVRVSIRANDRYWPELVMVVQR